MSAGRRVVVSPREAAALHRLLQAYLVSEDGDAGIADLATFYAKVERVEQDHTAYREAAADAAS